jgi:hypothetical protein
MSAGSNPGDGQLVFREAISPFDAACTECGREFADGDPYSQRLVGVSAEATFVEIVCRSCALPTGL